MCMENNVHLARMPTQPTKPSVICHKNTFEGLSSTAKVRLYQDSFKKIKISCQTLSNILKMIGKTILSECVTLGHTQIRCINSSSTSITKIHRSVYARTYPTVVVLPDGSSINTKYYEPRKIIKVNPPYYWSTVLKF